MRTAAGAVARRRWCDAATPPGLSVAAAKRVRKLAADEVRGELLAAKKGGAPLLDANADGERLFTPAEVLPHALVASCDSEGSVQSRGDSILRSLTGARESSPEALPPSRSCAPSCSATARRRRRRPAAAGDLAVAVADDGGRRRARQRSEGGGSALPLGGGGELLPARSRWCSAARLATARRSSCSKPAVSSRTG